MAVAFADKLLEQQGRSGERAHLFTQRVQIMKQIDLLPKGAKAFLQHNREAQAFCGLLHKSEGGIAYGREGFGGENGARHGDSRLLQAQVGKRLVIAPQNALRGVKKPQTALLKLLGQVHVLIPKEHEVKGGRVKGGSIHNGAQFRVGAHVQLHTLAMRRGEQRHVDIVKFGGAQEGVDHH